MLDLENWRRTIRAMYGKSGPITRRTKKLNAAHKAKSREINIQARADANRSRANNKQMPCWHGCIGPAGPFK